MNKEQLYDEIDARFKHYAPQNQEEILIHQSIRVTLRDTAVDLVHALPEKVTNSREFSQVLTDLENAMMHANQAYARHKND